MEKLKQLDDMIMKFRKDWLATEHRHQEVDVVLNFINEYDDLMDRMGN